MLLLIHLVDDRGSAAHRLIAEKDRRHGLQTSDPVMIDNLQDIRLLDAIHGLHFLVVIHQNNLLLLGI